MKRFLFIVISFISISSAKADDIEIATESQLREFANSVNGGNTYAGVTVKLTADIDLNNVDWMPIGTLAYPFQGTFDGQGHWVDNLKVNVSGSATGNGNVAGLFGCVGESGTVSRVGVRSGNIHINGKTSDDASCYVGGIAGLNQGHIYQCANFAVVLGNWKMAHVGGIAGANGNIGGGTTSALIENCYNRGEVFTSTGTSADGNYLGGIVGLNDGTVLHVYSSAEVSNAAHQGGIVGDNHGTVENAYATGNMLGYALDGSLNTQGDYSVWKFNMGLLPTLTLGSYVLVLEDDADNATSLTNNNGKTCDVVINGRTLYKDGYWNTLCLPFNMTEEQVTAQLAPATEGMKTLTSTNYEESTNTLYLNFEDATKVQAGVPFIVKWEAGTHWENPVFSNVTIDNSLTATETTYADFIGNYAPISLEANGTTLYLGSDNTLYYPTTSIPFGACRAYFQLKGDIFAGESAPAVNSFALNFDGEANGIKNVQPPMDNGQWYTIDGRRLIGKPVERGFYIHQGKKVFVK